MKSFLQCALALLIVMGIARAEAAPVTVKDRSRLSTDALLHSESTLAAGSILVERQVVPAVVGLGIPHVLTADLTLPMSAKFPRASVLRKGTVLAPGSVVDINDSHWLRPMPATPILPPPPDPVPALKERIAELEKGLDCALTCLMAARGDLRNAKTENEALLKEKEAEVKKIWEELSKAKKEDAEKIQALERKLREAQQTIEQLRRPVYYYYYYWPCR